MGDEAPSGSMTAGNTARTSQPQRTTPTIRFNRLASYLELSDFATPSTFWSFIPHPEGEKASGMNGRMDGERTTPSQSFGETEAIATPQN